MATMQETYSTIKPYIDYLHSKTRGPITIRMIQDYLNTLGITTATGKPWTHSNLEYYLHRFDYPRRRDNRGNPPHKYVAKRRRHVIKANGKLDPPPPPNEG
jgi:hypothetical protein